MSLRDMFVEIGMDIDDGPLKDLNNELDDLTKTIQGGVVDDLEKDLKDASKAANDVGKNMNTVDESIKDSNNSTGLFRKTLMGLGGILAGLGLGAIFLSTGQDAIQSAADAQAMSAQFEQVFGEIQTEAQNTIDQLGKDFGMVPNRIKPAMSQMASMFKGLGLDSEKAMTTAAEATTLVADAAAFYDKSFEDANSSLNSFIKGNYEGGESIGLFANETQLATFAAKQLNQDWKKLDEAGKQLARLEYAKIMQEAAGATGQASRESDSLTNQMGNLKQAWQDVLAKIGEPVLPIAVGYITDFSNKLQEFDTKPIVEGITNTIDKSIEFGTAIKENWTPIKETVIGLGTAVLTFKGIMLGMSIIGTINTLMIAYRTGTLAATLAQYGLNTAMLANPLTWVVAGIAALIAIGVLLYRNWDTVKIKAGELWNKTKEVFGNIYDWGMDKIQPVTDFFKGLSDKFNDFKSTITSFKLPKWVTTIGSTISNASSKVAGWVSGSHATGLGRVPYDGYVAELHKDEAILTAEQSNALRSSGMLSGDGVAPSLSLGQDYKPLEGSPSNSTTTTSNRSSTVQASVTIKVDGSGNPKETARSIKDELEDWFSDLSDVFPVVMEA